jgi:hypothetical protein
MPTWSMLIIETLIVLNMMKRNEVPGGFFHQLFMFDIGFFILWQVI